MNSYIEGLFSLNGKVAIVTGGSRGIGLALADALSSAGAHVIAIGRSEEISGPHIENIQYISCDINNRNRFSEICRTAFDKHGRVDILVNAAGITLPSSDLETRANTFNETIANNLTAVFNCCEIAAEYMKKSGGGSIINVTSIGSLQGFPGNPGYVASKGGLRMLTKALAIDFATHNIRANNLVPGYIRTSMTEQSYKDDNRRKQRTDRTILQRWGNVDDLAGAAVFLASNASAYVTGSDIVVDGGWTAKGL